MGGYFSLSTTCPSKGVLFLNFFMVSHVATICTFGPILADLLELFFGASNHCHELWVEGPRLLLKQLFSKSEKNRQKMGWKSLYCGHLQITTICQILSFKKFYFVFSKLNLNFLMWLCVAVLCTIVLNVSVFFCYYLHI